MIKKITLENFFSFSESTTIDLNSGVNILVGINGSGKSNFLKGIRFLYESISGKGIQKIFLNDWGGFNTVANFNVSKADRIKLTYEFDKKIINNGKGFQFPGNPVYEVIIRKTGVTSYYLEESLSCNYGEPEEYITLLKMENGNGFISTVENNAISGIQRYDRGDIILFFDEQELMLRQNADPSRFLPLHTLKQAIESIAGYDYFDTSFESNIRQRSFDGIETKLLSTGENLVQLLSRIKNYRTLQYEEIEAMLNKVNPNFKDISFDIFGNKVYLALREKKLAQTVGIGQISDGTLRFLLLLSIFLNPERGYLVSLDEPEIGLHPDMIHTVAETIKKASVNSQLIIATHSPQLLNSFDIEDVLVFEKDENNKTTVTRKSEDDFEDWNDDFLVGQLWLRGKIGGKRW